MFYVSGHYRVNTNTQHVDTTLLKELDSTAVDVCLEP
jgi:hypothetical protein